MMDDAEFLVLKNRYYHDFKCKTENWEGLTPAYIEQAALRWGYETAMGEARRHVVEALFGKELQEVQSG